MKIGLFTDSHGLLEPTQAVVEDMKKNNVDQIYSLGDNIGLGPNSGEVIDLIRDNNIISISGNSEEYCRLGTEPFQSYFNYNKEISQAWTKEQLDEEQLRYIDTLPRSIELLFGGKKIALCHFANDVRCDFDERSTFTYQYNNGYSDPYKQFLYTNSKEQQKEVERHSKTNSTYDKGFLSYSKEPLFNGNKVTYYDAIFQGHVHYKIVEKTQKTNFYTLRAVGMPCGGKINTAYYVSLLETSHGYKLEEHYIPFDREKMEYSILNSTSNDKTIMKYTGMNR